MPSFGFLGYILLSYVPAGTGQMADERCSAAPWGEPHNNDTLATYS